MKRTTQRRARHANRTRLLHKRWQKAVGALACLVVFCTTYALILPAITMEEETYCGYQEHRHDESCIEQTLVCTQSEEGHTHTEDCYITQQLLTCTEEEHTHSQEAGCYDEDGNLICPLAEHTHGDGCYATEQVLNCDLSEEGHVHTEDCYETVYTCGVEEEHVHSLACYSNPDADVETAAAWEKTMSGVSLTGDYADDLVAIAETQLGYTESSKNYQVAEDGTTKRGYTRYGDWYGDPYGDWCAMFVSFCLNYADVPSGVFPREASCVRWIAALTDMNLYQKASYTPEPGDLVFFDTDGDGSADHVGIVSGVTDSGLTAIEGNCADSVKTRTYDLTDGTIRGFGVLPENPEPADENQPAALSLDDEDGTVTADEGTVTITFEVNNADYTSDPGSGNTHLTAASAIEGGELTYTYWTKNTYKVTGTGTVCSVTIPKGTSLNENSLATPNLSTTNIGSENKYSFGSLLSWVTEENMVCTKYTVFLEDTVLYLSLYQSSGEETNYSIDYVCCADENLSISNYLGRSTAFKLGQSVAADAIPTADEVINSGFTSSTHDVSAFAGWQLKKYETGEMVDFCAGMPITADYVDPEYGTIKAYAVWSDGEETPGEGEEGVFYSVILHDILPDGKEADVSIDLSVASGTTLSEALSESELADGKAASDCVWYTLGEDETKTKVDLSASVTADMELYTYTYQIVLTLNPSSQTTQTSQYSVMSRSMVVVDEDTDGTLKLTITARGGETLSASDFVIDGVDYSLYTWTTEDGTTVDIQDLITNGLTQNIEATSDGTLASVDDTATGTIRFYASIDGEWQLWKEESLTAYLYNGSYWLTAAQMEYIYGELGFKASDLTAEASIFPHTNKGDSTIWANRTAIKIESIGVLTPILQTGVTCDVYYCPNDQPSYNGNPSDYKDDNTFYTVRVYDPGNKVYTSDTLPGPFYFLTGTDATVTVNNAEGVTWKCVGTNGSAVTGAVNSDNTTTFTITGISQAYVISPVLEDDEVIVFYDINLPEPPSDAEYGAPTIGGGSTYSVAATTEDVHTVLAPSLTSYFYNIQYNGANRYLGEATFLGWAVNGNTENLVQPDVRLDLSAYAGQTVTLTAQWSTNYASDSKNDGSMVNFFVALSALPEGTTSWAGNTETDKFTTSVYTADCHVKGSDVVSNKLYESVTKSQYYVLGGTSGTDLNAYHNTITGELTNGYTMTGSGGNSYTYQLSFPTDEEVLRTIRQMVQSGTKIKINDHTITADELTTENFTIKWYVFKYAAGDDGWHIDGILVAKKGQLVVTKTFAGDDDAINKVKDSYSISVAAEVADGVVHTGSVLSLSDDNYDPDTNTYTWVLAVDQYYDYTVTENDYIYTGDDLYACTASYRVSHSNTAAQNTDGWVAYTSGVTVTGRGYNEGDSARLTVSFLNTYTPPGTVILQKVDAATGNRMSGVEFTIAKTGDSSFTLYDKGNSYYTAETTESLDGTNTIITDYSGQAYLFIGGGTYTLTESVPTGYDSPGTITVELAGEEGSAYKVIGVTSISAENLNHEFVGSDNDTNSDAPVMIVRNYSRTVDLVMEKIWEDGENKPVTLQLYRNDTPMGDAYTVTLDGTTDTTETTPWTATFDGLPLYADGGLARYTIREEALGDFYYSEEYSDGYLYYDVTCSPMSYLDSHGDVTESHSDIDTICLSVTNKRSTGELTIQKVDAKGNALAGAEFYLYTSDTGDDTELTAQKDENGGYALKDMTPVQTATSDATGKVNFGQMNAGTYYLVEHTAPAGYYGSDAVYKLVFDGKERTLYQLNNDEWELVPGGQVVNEGGYQLPASGGPGGTLLYSLGGLMLLAAAAGYGCTLRRRREGRGE